MNSLFTCIVLLSSIFNVHFRPFSITLEQIQRNGEGLTIELVGDLLEMKTETLSHLVSQFA
jgi:hypothetical protein